MRKLLIWFVILLPVLIVGILISGIIYNGLSKDNAMQIGPSTFKWQAKYIWINKDGNDQIPCDEADTWAIFRKNVNIENKEDIENVIARIAVDSRYWLYINEQLVIREGGVKRGEKPDSIYYDEIDITKYLQEGDNTIAVLAWYFGISSFSHISSDQGAFLFQAKIGDELIISDETWKATKNPAYLKDRRPNNQRLSETSIYYNANYELENWYKKDFDDSAWKNAFVCGATGDMPWGELIPRDIPEFKYSDLKDYLNSKQYHNMELKEDTLIKLDLPHNVQFTPYLKVDAPKDLTIQIALDENYSEQGKEQRTTYVTKEGVQEFESLEWINGEKVYYHIPAGVKIIDLKYRETGFDTTKVGDFISDDEFYNDLWDMAYKTLYVNMRDTYMDCPNRERALWWGDNSVAMQQAMYVFDSNSYSLFKKAVKTQIGWRDNNILMTVVPSKESKLHLPVQNLIGITTMYDYYKYTGDKEFLKYIYPYLKSYINQWDINKETGLPVLTNETNLWKWGDSTEIFDYYAIENGWYYYAMKSIYNMAVELNYQPEITELKARLDALYLAYNDAYWTEKGYKGYSDEMYDVRANSVAVLSGLATKNKYEQISKILVENFENSTFMEKFVLETLCEMGKINEAQTRIKTQYSQMVAGKENYSSTLWEYWDGEFGTRNHTWAGGPLVMMSKYFAGIKPLKEGYKEILIKPERGELNKIECKTYTPEGIVSLNLQKEENELSIEVSVPAKTMIAIEKTSENPTIKQGINTIYKNGRAKNTSKIVYDHKDENYIYFYLEPGEYKFISK